MAAHGALVTCSLVASSALLMLCAHANLAQDSELSYRLRSERRRSGERDATAEGTVVGGGPVAYGPGLRAPLAEFVDGGGARRYATLPDVMLTMGDDGLAAPALAAGALMLPASELERLALPHGARMTPRPACGIAGAYVADGAARARWDEEYAGSAFAGLFPVGSHVDVSYASGASMNAAISVPGDGADGAAGGEARRRRLVALACAALAAGLFLAAFA